MAVSKDLTPSGDDPDARRRVHGSHGIGDLVGIPSDTDDTLPPMPLRNLLAAGGASVFVLSVDAALVDTVQRAAGEQYPVFSVDNLQELENAIDDGRCGIALLDADFPGGRLAKTIKGFARHSSRLVTLVAAARVDAQAFIGLVSERKIHRLLIKPPTLGITRLLLESAVKRCIQLRAAAGQESALVPDRPVRASASRGFGRTEWALAVGAGVAVLGAGVIFAFSMLRAPTTGPRASTEVSGPGRTDAVAGSAAEAGADAQLGDLLARAERAFSEGRLIEPPGDSALDYYLTILAADPTQAIARDRLALVVDALFTQAETALLAGSSEEAAAALAGARRADVSSGRLAFLEAQLEKARAAEAASRQAAEQAAAAAQAPALAGAPTEIDSLLAIAAARLEKGQLLAPAGDSAREYLARAQRLGADDPRVQALRAELAAALVTGARARVTAGDDDAAADMIAAARALGADTRLLAPLDRQVTSARATRVAQQREDRLAIVRARIEDGALVEPQDDSALSHLTALEQEAPDMPELAEAWDELVGLLAGNVRTALQRGDFSGAESAVAALQRTGHGADLARDLAPQVASARLQEQYLRTIATASDLKLLNYAPPTYPPDALRSQIEGWVELEFILGRDGSPRDVVVVGAEPLGRFEPSAVAAVTMYRYDPFVRDGVAYERRVRLRIRFALR
jgi:TonB family protein